MGCTAQVILVTKQNFISYKKRVNGQVTTQILPTARYSVVLSIQKLRAQAP
ncbi:hypothetical protein HMPREF1861_01914 [Corynebacterium kroppenstedtii]|nr:hypothetical protein HMPREF1861_01914 [Corynebacterium kroppenstedtii]